MIRSYVLFFGGTEIDAEDLYQEVLISILSKAKDKSFILTSSFSTFVFSISKNLWHKILQKRQSIGHHYNIDFVNERYLEYSASEDVKVEQKKNILYNKHFSELNIPCQKILDLFFQKKSYKEIAKIMGYNSTNYLKKLKHECVKRLMKEIKSDPDFDNL